MCQILAVSQITKGVFIVSLSSTDAVIGVGVTRFRHKVKDYKKILIFHIIFLAKRDCFAVLFALDTILCKSELLRRAQGN